MKKARVLSLILSLVMIISILPGTLNVATAAEEEQFAHFAEDTAFVTFHGDLKSRYASFIDGITLGITDTNDPNFYELVNLDGLEARKQYRANTTYITINKPFYEDGDDEFIFTLMYYSFGPDEGPLKVEYYKEDGTLHLQDLVKPAGDAHWDAKTVFAYDVKVGGYPNGATFRIVNGAYNAFRKVEIANLSKHKRAGTVPDVRTLYYEDTRNLKRSHVVDSSDVLFSAKNAYKPATKYDILTWVYKYTFKKDIPADTTKNETMTQAELLKLFMDMAELDYSGATNIVEFAYEKKFINDQSFFLYDNAVATYYNLAAVMEGLLEYELTPNYPYILKMYHNKYFGDMEVAEVGNDLLSAVYYVGESYWPYEIITDNQTGRTFKYVNFFGSMLMRPYLTEQSWLPDGKRFLCGTRAGYLYIYNTETQIMKFMAKGLASSNDSDGIVGYDGMIYYIGTDGEHYTLMKVDPDDPELKSELAMTFPGKLYFSTMTISADGKWIGGDMPGSEYLPNLPEYKKAKIALNDDGYYPQIILRIPDNPVPGVPDGEEYKFDLYQFPEPFKGNYGHVQVNPVYTDYIFFCHEGNVANYGYSNIFDRTNVHNFATGENFTYNPGQTADRVLVSSTHESWSADGEYLYLVSNGNGNSGVTRLNKDMSHRQVYYFDNDKTTSFTNFNHCYPKDDNVWCVTDGNWISLINMKTHQIFNITRHQESGGHPYHAHAHVAHGEGNNMMNWGYVRKGVLGVAWYDYTEIVENEVLDGGRYKVNEYVERVSFEGSESESRAVKYMGEDALNIRGGKELFLEVNPEIVDTTNDRVRVTFDYFDNGNEPIIMKYTLGVTNEKTEAHLRYNSEQRVYRKGTNKWKTATFEFDGNMESIGKYESDIKFVSGAQNVYVANIKVEKVEK